MKKGSLPRLADPAVESVGYFHRLAASVRGVAGRCGATSGELLASPASGQQDFWPLLTTRKSARLLPAGPARTLRAAQYGKVGVSFYYIEDR